MVFYTAFLEGRNRMSSSGAHLSHRTVKQSQLCGTHVHRLCSQWVGALDGSAEMFRVSQSLSKPPARLWARLFLQSVLAKHLQIQVRRGAAHSIIGETGLLGSPREAVQDIGRYRIDNKGFGGSSGHEFQS